MSDKIIRKVVSRTRKAMKADRGKGSVFNRDYNVPEYRNGAEGMIKWVEDHCYGEITPISLDEDAFGDIKIWVKMSELPDTPHPDTGRSYKEMWEKQKNVLRKALEMKNGVFLNRLIVLCWPRGEGKSFLTCLIQLWKFFCWPRQQIMLGANSKDQVKFVHFDIMRDIIRHSPDLHSQVGERNIQEKEIRLTNEKGNVDSVIRSISSFTGIVSNITGYTFSEMFDMKNPKFFVQLDGSIRNVPNAMGVIDSTVSAKTHVLYSLYINYIDKKTKTLFYSYRNSVTGDISDYWHPLMTEDQLSDYKAKFPFGEFERYFLNLWSVGTARVFTDEMIEATSIYAIDKSILNNTALFSALEEKNTLIEVKKDAIEKHVPSDLEEISVRIVRIYERMQKIDEIYALSSDFGSAKMATINDFTNLENIFDTHFALIAGIDRGDPSAIRGKARTIVGVIAKGLPGSRSNPHIANMLATAPRYLYLILLLANIETHSLETIKEVLEKCNEEFEGIDSLCSERYGTWDMEDWCKDRQISFEPVYPNYDRQKEAFNELYNIIKAGLFKCPITNIWGSKKEDILREEMLVFDHDTDKKWFGSPEKGEKYGIQDDCIYTIGWSVYGGRNINSDLFRIRKSMTSFGVWMPDKSVIGNYK